MLFLLCLYGCGNMTQSHIIDKENQFFYKGQVNLYSNINKKKIIKKFYEFSNNEDWARKNVKLTCLNYIKINKLIKSHCRYMGTKPTERILTSLDG